MRAVAVVSIAVTLAGCAASAQPSHLGAGGKDGVPSVVSVDSRYGHGTVSGPVRRGARNFEVRLPGGTWVDCERDCADTLRRQSVDFWENHGRDGRDGPGYFTWRR